MTHQTGAFPSGRRASSPVGTYTLGGPVGALAGEDEPAEFGAEESELISV